MQLEIYQTNVFVLERTCMSLDKAFIVSCKKAEEEESFHTPDEDRKFSLV